jgi:hypothetical protein
MIPPSMKARKLYDEHFVFVQRKGHPRGTAPLDLDTYCTLDHVLVSTSGGSFHGFMDEHLDELGRERHVALSVQHFTLVPELLSKTDYVSTLPSRFAARYADRLDTFALPFDARGFTLYAAWHPRNQADPALVWLRETLAELAAQKESIARYPYRSRNRNKFTSAQSLNSRIPPPFPPIDPSIPSAGLRIPTRTPRFYVENASQLQADCIECTPKTLCNKHDMSG